MIRHGLRHSAGMGGGTRTGRTRRAGVPRGPRWARPGSSKCVCTGKRPRGTADCGWPLNRGQARRRPGENCRVQQRGRSPRGRPGKIHGVGAGQQAGAGRRQSGRGRPGGQVMVCDRTVSAASGAEFMGRSPRICPAALRIDVTAIGGSGQAHRSRSSGRYRPGQDLWPTWSCRKPVLARRAHHLRRRADLDADPSAGAGLNATRVGKSDVVHAMRPNPPARAGVPEREPRLAASRPERPGRSAKYSPLLRNHQVTA